MHEKKSTGKDMTSGEPFKLIFFYSVPILLGNIFQQFYSMCDTIIVGRLLGPDSLAAVGNTGPMNFLVMGFLFGITSGCAVITAQRYGAQDKEGLRRSVAINIIINSSIAILFTITSCLMTMPLLKLINTPEEVINLSFTYIIIIFLGLPAVVLYNSCACILRAVGDSKTPLYFLILSSVLNIILDIIFILICKWGVAGAALATVLSQLASGIGALIRIIIKFPFLHVTKKHFMYDEYFTKKQFLTFAMNHLKTGLSMGFQFSITAVGVIILQGALNKFGPVKMAAFTAAQKVSSLVTVAATAFGITMANYGGQNLGAGRIDRIKEGVTKACIITCSFAVISGILAWFFCDNLTSLFLNNNFSDIEKNVQIIQLSRQYLRICVLFYPILFILFVYRNVLQSMGRGFWPLMGGVFELIARTIGAYTLPSIMGFKGIIISEPAAWCAATIPLAIAYYIIISRIKITNKR